MSSIPEAGEFHDCNYYFCCYLSWCRIDVHLGNNFPFRCHQPDTQELIGTIDAQYTWHKAQDKHFYVANLTTLWQMNECVVSPLKYSYCTTKDIHYFVGILAYTSFEKGPIVINTAITAVFHC